MPKGYVVTEEINGAHQRLSYYQLLPGDLLVPDGNDGTWWKECPGVAVGGFLLTEAQRATLREVEYEVFGLSYRYDDGLSRSR
jgi:hypothetical protein